MEEIGCLVGRLRCISFEFRIENQLIGGKLLDNQTIVDIGLQLVDSCWNTYASTRYIKISILSH
jgi:hypothetical protein